MVDVDSIAIPLMIWIWRDWPTTRNSNPETTGSVTDSAPLPDVRMVSRADSPTSICDGSMLASTEGAAAEAAAAAKMPRVMAAIMAAWRSMRTLMSPISHGLIRRRIGRPAGDRQTQRVPLLSLL